MGDVLGGRGRARAGAARADERLAASSVSAWRVLPGFSSFEVGVGEGPLEQLALAGIGQLVELESCGPPERVLVQLVWISMPLRVGDDEQRRVFE